MKEIERKEKRKERKETRKIVRKREEKKGTFLALAARSSWGSASTPSLICWKRSEVLNPATFKDIAEVGDSKRERRGKSNQLKFKD